jgi:hypothetical protein
MQKIADDREASLGRGGGGWHIAFYSRADADKIKSWLGEQGTSQAEGDTDG